MQWRFSDSPLVWDLLTSFWPAWYLVSFSTCISRGRMSWFERDTSRTVSRNFMLVLRNSDDCQTHLSQFRAGIVSWEVNYWVLHDRCIWCISVRLSDRSKVTHNKINFVKNCPLWGLNPQPPDHQSHALPLC